MKLSVIMHFYNESLLIKDWIRHHEKIFDTGILINHASTDDSLMIATKLLPYGWSIVNTRLDNFDAYELDREVEEWERKLSGWKWVSNTTEFIFTPNFREKLAAWEQQYPTALAFGSKPVCLVDRQSEPIETPIWKNRTHGFINYDKHIIRRWRYIHKAEYGHYEIGRHGVYLPKVDIPEFLHLHTTLSPWPECKKRKLQIQTRIPESDKQKGWGKEHIMTGTQLEGYRNSLLSLSSNLLDDKLFNFYYHEILENGI